MNEVAKLDRCEMFTWGVFLALGLVGGGGMVYTAFTVLR
jgi:hypothetical protein